MTPPRGSADWSRATRCSPSRGPELLERFEIIGEDGGPMPVDRLPNRLRIRRALAAGGVLGYRILPSGDERWSVVRSTPLLDDDGRGAARDQRLPRHHRGAERRGADPLPRRGEHAPLRLARLRGDARRPGGTCSSRGSPTTASWTRSARTKQALRQVVISHRNPEREELLRELRRRYPPEANEAHPVIGGARERRAAPVEDARRDALAHAAVDEEHLALYHALDAMSYIVVPLEARGRLLGTISLGTGESGRAVREDRSRARARDRAARGARDRQRTPVRSRAGVVRAARHAARVGAGGDRLLGSRAPLRPRERRARRRQSARRPRSMSAGRSRR